MDEPMDRPGAPLRPPLIQPLNYARLGSADRETGGQGEVVVGVTCSILLMVVGTVVGVATSLDQASRVRFFISVGLTALYCNGLALVAYRDPSYRRVGVGMWIGFGVAVAIGWMCYRHMMRL